MNGYNGPGASGIRSASPSPNGHDFLILAKQKSSILWLLSKAFDNDIPKELEDPYYNDHHGEDRLKPLIVQSLASAEFYGKALSNIYAHPDYQNLNHSGVLHVLARKGIYIQDPHDTILTESVLQMVAPIKMSAHMVIIEAIMSLYIKEVLIPEKVVEVVHRFQPIDHNDELPEEAEDAAIFWINKSCQKFRERINLELGLLTPTEDEEEEEVPDIPAVEYLWDLSDGVSLASLLAFYCPDELSWRNINYSNPMHMNDSIYNLQLIQLFCAEKLPCDIFFLSIEDFFDCNKVFRINILAFVADLLYHFEIRPVDCVRLPTERDLMSTEDELFLGFNNGMGGTLVRVGQRMHGTSSTPGHGFSAINHRLVNRQASVAPVGHQSSVGGAPAGCHSASTLGHSSTRYGRRRSSITSNYGRNSFTGEGNYSTSGLADMSCAADYSTPPTSANNSSSTLRHSRSSLSKGRRSSLDHSTREEEDLSRYFSILEVEVDPEPGRVTPATNNSPEQLHSSHSLHDVSISPRNSLIFNNVYPEVTNSSARISPHASGSPSSYFTNSSAQRRHQLHQQPQQDHVSHSHRQQVQRHSPPSPIEHSPFVLNKSQSFHRTANTSTPRVDHSSESSAMAPRNSSSSSSQLSSNHDSSRNIPAQLSENKNSISSLHRNSSSSGIVPQSTPFKGRDSSHQDTKILSNSNATQLNSSDCGDGQAHQSQSTVHQSVSPRPVSPLAVFIGLDGSVNTKLEPAVTSTSQLSMEKKREMIVQKSLKRKAEQEAKRLKLQEEAARKREEEYRKNEESERKKEEEKYRKQKILEEYKLKKHAEEERKRGDTVDWVRSNGSSSSSSNLGMNGGHSNNKHATVVLNRQRGRFNSNASGESVSSTGTATTRGRPKSLHVSNTLVEEFLSLDQRPSKTPAGTSSGGLSSSPPAYNSSHSRNDSFNPMQSNNNLSSTGSSRPRSALSTSSKMLSSTSTSHLSSIMPSMPTLYQRNRGPPSDGASDVGSNFSEYTGPKLYVKPSQKSNRGIILNAINVVLAGTVNAETKRKVIEEINKSTAKHFLILFRGAGFQFRAIYTFCPDSEEAEKLYGTGPKLITNDKVEKIYKFNSGCKNFAIVHTKHLSITIDGFTILNHLWTVNAARKATQSNSNIHAAAEAASRPTEN